MTERHSFCRYPFMPRHEAQGLHGPFFHGLIVQICAHTESVLGVLLEMHFHRNADLQTSFIEKQGILHGHQAVKRSLVPWTMNTGGVS